MASGFSVKELSNLSTEEFADYLEKEYDDEVSEIFKKNKIDGSVFMLMNENQLSALVPAVGDVIRFQELQKHVKKLNGTPLTPVTPVSNVCNLI
jgi:hypothetical protein